MKIQEKLPGNKLVPTTTFILISILIVAGMYIYSRPGTLTLLSQSSGIKDMGKESQWFKGESEGLSCSTWFTCKSEGALLRELYIEQNGTIFPLGKRVGSYTFVDIHGQSPVGVKMESCIGNDEGVSFEIKKAETGSRYKKGDDVLVLVTVRTHELRRNVIYEYVLPSRALSLEEEYKAVIVYDASIEGETQTYAQHAHARKCSIQ